MVYPRTVGISSVFAPTSTWSMTRASVWVATGFALHRDRDQRRGSGSDSRTADCRASQAPITAATAAASAPVTTRQIVVLEGVPRRTDRRVGPATRRGH